ncbi:MBL fold metallo-hydrolase [Fodinibius sp.]|uniref:MBL fold metallo-hydrolase n=1 Tax=Fodinibius sp. TaxID=1872440 RepID=UPI002ACEE8CF|nr:MBL fold metallo-hydrolase [Fodinibius sp.]MDZ7657801.1 MBL fold metallo-hydrolase [Fodinibius sp.]
MNIGSFTVEVLSEGHFELFEDGHINRSKRTAHSGSTPKYPSDSNAVMVGINPVLVQSGGQNILLDTGLGWGLDAGSQYTDVSNVCTNLRIFGLTPKDITHVILTHLHYDHAAGSSFTDAEAKTQPTFPNATYYVHQQEWDFALEQSKGQQLSYCERYRLDDFYRLVSDERVTFLSGNKTEIMNGITVVKTGGHTPGHQIVILESDGEKAYYMGDLLPTEYQLNEYAMERADIYPLEAKKKKVRLLQKACDEKALLLFYHSGNGQAGHLFKDDDKKYVLAKQLP